MGVDLKFKAKAQTQTKESFETLLSVALNCLLPEGHQQLSGVENTLSDFTHMLMSLSCNQVVKSSEETKRNAIKMHELQRHRGGAEVTWMPDTRKNV